MVKIGFDTGTGTGTGKGFKDDKEKLKWNLIELERLSPMIKALMFGAKKYGVDNWKDLPEANVRYYEALMRHIAQYQTGEINDEESGLPHLAHAQCCLYFLMYFCETEVHN